MGHKCEGAGRSQRGGGRPPRGHTSECRPKLLRQFACFHRWWPSVLLGAYAACCLCCLVLMLQDIFNLLPNMNVEALSKALAGAAWGGGRRQGRGGPLRGWGGPLSAGTASMGREDGGTSVLLMAVSSSPFFLVSSSILPDVLGPVYFLSAVKSNDMMLVIYVASLIRSILALHKLIDNKEQRLWGEKEAIKAKVGAGGLMGESMIIGWVQ